MARIQDSRSAAAVQPRKLPRQPAADRVAAAADVLAVARALIDAAALRGEGDAAVIAARVVHAVRGYLRVGRA